MPATPGCPLNPVQRWFGPRFSLLHPELQALHLHGGRLRGEVDLTTGTGLAGIIGRRLARRMGLPEPGRHAFAVDIHHDGRGLHWQRRIGSTATMNSYFVPHGVQPDGHWTEDSGPLQLRLTVDIIDGGWYWRCLGVSVGWLRLPRWLFPRSVGHKRFEQGKYRFRVAIALPLLGEVLSYGGVLDAVPLTP